MAKRPTVLVIDDLEETHEVLRTALGRQGIDVIAAPNSAGALSTARRCTPNLIVYDLENDGSSTIVAGRLAAESTTGEICVVFLGTGEIEEGGGAFCTRLAKPYHYSALIRKIEELLGGAADGAQRPAAQAA